MWPHTSEIAREQGFYLPFSNLERDSDGLLVDSKKRIVIPYQCKSLRLRLCIIAHAGSRSGHLGYHTSLSLLKQRVYWIDMEKDIRDICSSCLHCLPTRKGHRIPPPLGEACHGIRPNQVLHFDYMYICPKLENSINYQWLFIIRDDFSGLVSLKPVIMISL